MILEIWSNLDPVAQYLIGIIGYAIANHLLPPGITKHFNKAFELLLKSGQTPGGLKLK